MNDLLLLTFLLSQCFLYSGFFMPSSRSREPSLVGSSSPRPSCRFFVSSGRLRPSRAVGSGERGRLCYVIRLVRIRTGLRIGRSCEGIRLIVNIFRRKRKLPVARPLSELFSSSHRRRQVWEIIREPVCVLQCASVYSARGQRGNGRLFYFPFRFGEPSDKICFCLESATNLIFPSITGPVSVLSCPVCLVCLVCWIDKR